ncbi:MAG TPA: Uma2 family endonuclease [Candidatus Sulfotelmatobacter sp.]|nr:Uma2 family endonuclease [Candidatus Sulfotelmatobacter sp.]
MATPRFTLEDYLADENAGPVRHDFIDGLRYARPAPTAMHRHLSDQLGRRLRAHLRHDASYVFTGGIRIHVPAFDAVYYADAAVAVDPVYQEGTFVRQPILAIDIFAVGAPGPNRRRRLAHYLSLEALRQYVLLAPHQMSAMVYSRDEEENAWYQEAIGAGDVLHLTSVSLALPLDALYDGAPEGEAAHMTEAGPVAGSGLVFPWETEEC